MLFTCANKSSISPWTFLIWFLITVSFFVKCKYCWNFEVIIILLRAVLGSCYDLRHLCWVEGWHFRLFWEHCSMDHPFRNLVPVWINVMWCVNFYLLKSLVKYLNNSLSGVGGVISMSWVLGNVGSAKEIWCKSDDYKRGNFIGI